MEKIPPGTKLLIATTESIEAKPDLILNSVFIETLPDNHLTFTAPIFEDTVYPLVPGEKLYVRYQTEEGVFNFACTVIMQPVIDSGFLIKAHLDSGINRKQYRGFYRMKKAIQGQVAKEKYGDVTVSDFMTHDISASGLFIYTNEYFSLGDVLGVSLPVSDNEENISLYSEVVWVRESPRYDYTYCAGLNFIYEDKQEQERMAKYVFDLQLAIIQKRPRDRTFRFGPTRS